MSLGYHCHECGHEITLDVKVARLDTCDNCDADLHCCNNCHFYDHRADRCRENITTYVRNRDRANFCASFRFRETEANRGEEVEDAKARLDALFKGL